MSFLNINDWEKTVVGWIPLIVNHLVTFLLALLTLWVGWWLISKLSHRIRVMIHVSHFDKALENFIVTIVNVGLKILLLVSVASMLGIQTTSFVAAIGAAGLAIGMALQGSLSTFAGGVLILVFRPFRIGDQIDAMGVSGTVDDIQIFHTFLHTADNKMLILPNGTLSNSTIVNYDRLKNRQLSCSIVADKGTDVGAARQVLLHMAEQDHRVHKEPAPSVVVSAIADSTITLTLRVWVSSQEFGGLQFSFNEKVNKLLADNGIGAPPAAPQVVYMVPHPDPDAVIALDKDEGVEPIESVDANKTAVPNAEVQGSSSVTSSDTNLTSPPPAGNNAQSGATAAAMAYEEALIVGAAKEGEAKKT